MRRLPTSVLALEPSVRITFVDSFAGSFQAEVVNFNAGLFDFGDNNTLVIGHTGNIAVTTFNFSGGVLTGDTLDVDSATGVFNWTGGMLSVETYDGNGDPLAQVAGILNPGASTRPVRPLSRAITICRPAERCRWICWARTPMISIR